MYNNDSLVPDKEVDDSVTIYFTSVRSGEISVWLEGAEVTFSVREKSRQGVRVESDRALNFSPRLPGGPDCISWADYPTIDHPPYDVVVELPPGTKVVVTDLATYDVDDDADLVIVDMRT